MLWALIMCSLSTFSNSVKGNDNRFNKVNFQALPSLEISLNQGVSGAYSGNIDGQAIVAGGCNFPNTPAAEGGAKVFYNAVYALRGKQWTKNWRITSCISLWRKYNDSRRYCLSWW